MKRVKKNELEECAKKILLAEEEGKRAWRMLVVNGMLANQFRQPRQYRWRPSELAQLAGVLEDSIVLGRSPNDTEHF